MPAAPMLFVLSQISSIMVLTSMASEKAMIESMSIALLPKSMEPSTLSCAIAFESAFMPVKGVEVGGGGISSDDNRLIDGHVHQ